MNRMYYMTPLKYFHYNQNKMNKRGKEYSDRSLKSYQDSII